MHESRENELENGGRDHIIRVVERGCMSGRIVNG